MPPPPPTSSLSLHDALPICGNAIAEYVHAGTPQVATLRPRAFAPAEPRGEQPAQVEPLALEMDESTIRDRKSTRLNSSHQIISYAVFCLKKKKDAYQTRPQH